MKIFVHLSDGSYLAYEGMDQETISAMLALQGLTCVFVDKAAYDAANN